MLIYNYHAVFTARDIVMEPSYDGALLHVLSMAIIWKVQVVGDCITNAAALAISFALYSHSWLCELTGPHIVRCKRTL